MTQSVRIARAGQVQIIGNSVFYNYDFAVSGGTVGTIVLADGPTLVAGDFVSRAFWRTLTTLTSGGSATVALTTGEAANDIQTAVAFDNAAFTAGMHVAGSVNKLITANRTPSIVIGTADLTAGKIRVWLEVTRGWA